MKTNPKAAEQAKQAGLKSLSEASELTGQSLQTLRNWSINKPDLFTVVIAGCLVIREYKKQNDDE